MPSTRSKRGSSSGKVTVNHNEIRRWVEQRGGHPACVKGTERSDSCLLRIDYPGFGGEGRLEPIEWDEFFDTFDKNKLAFVYQETKDGNPSRFSKLVDRGSVKGQANGSRGRRSSSGSLRRNGRGKTSGRRGGSAAMSRSSSRGRSNKRSAARSTGRSSGRATASRR